MGWYWMLYTAAIVMGAVMGASWGVFGADWWRKRHPPKSVINHALLDLTARQRTKIMIWTYHMYRKSNYGGYGRHALALANTGGNDLFARHYELLLKGESPLEAYPKSLRPALFKVLYPENGNDLAKWLRVNHRGVLNEYRVARKARERLFEDA